MTSTQFWKLVADMYNGKPDDFRVSVGDQRLPDPNRCIGISNVPEIVAVVSIDLGTLRKWMGQSTPAEREELAGIVANNYEEDFESGRSEYQIADAVIAAGWRKGGGK